MRTTCSSPSSVDSVYAAFPKLVPLRRRRAITLSGGEQQMVAIGRALMSRPRLLVLDEPSMGLAPVIIELIFGYITQLAWTSSMSVLLVEQRAAEALEAFEHIYVLERGRVAFSGPSGRTAAQPRDSTRLPRCRRERPS